MGVEKLSVSLGKDDVAWLRRQAKKARASLSSVVAASIRASREREAQLAKQHAAIAEYVEWATDGKGLSAAALKAAARELDAAVRK